MTVVKGSKPTRMVVVPYRPFLRPLLIAGVIAGVLLVGVVSFYLGVDRGSSMQLDAVTERDRLREELELKTKEAEELSQRVANLSLASEVDKASSEGVRNEVISLKSQIATLEEDISFYRGLMAPTDNKQGLTIGALEVISTGVPRQYQFKVVVQQFASNHQILTGTLNFNVVGREGEQVRTIPLKELTDQVDHEDIRLRFKYFQNIEGRMDLPAGFEPERIELIARSSGRDAVEVEKKFGWLVHES